MTNITLIGAGSASFSLELIRDICATQSLWGSTMTLMDIHPGRLRVAETIANRYRDEVKADLKFVATTDRCKSLEGADFVICAVKVGGYDPLEAERKIAEAHGYYRGIGDRVSCYYGGVGAYHQLKFILDLARDMEQICPNAWLIETANPVFEGTNLVTRQTRLKTVGVCHGHHCVNRLIDALGLNKAEVSTQMVGFNHFIWLTHFIHRGKNAYPLVDQWLATKSQEYWKTVNYNEQMSPGAFNAYQLYGLFPIGDAVRSGTPWWYHTDRQAKEQWFGKDGGFDSEIGWTRYLSDKAAEHKMWEKLAEHPEQKLLEKYPFKHGGEQHIHIVDAISNDKEMKLQLNIPNSGCIPGIADDVIVEIPALVSGRGIQGVKADKLPTRLLNGVLLPRMIAMENILHAFLNGDRKALVLMLMDDHRTRSFQQAKELIDTLLAQPWNATANEHYRW